MAIPNLAKFCVLALCLVCSQNIYAQPSANFNATPVSGCAPLVVSFHDLTTGNPTSWRWDLGNGTTSVLQNPSVTYFDPGTYAVKLVAQNASGKDSIIKTNYITIYAPPVVDFSVSLTSGCYPMTVHFQDLSTPSNGTISSWLWDFGDGNTSSLQHPNHVYTRSGNFNITLRVTNSFGCSKTITRSQYIHINDGVIASFNAQAPGTCTAPANVSFQNLSTGTGTISYLWNFGDGNTSTLDNPTHLYSTPGTYTVTLIATNSSGCKDTMIRANAISIGTVRAGFNFPDTVCQGRAALFTNTSAPVPSSINWTFGDGTFSTQLSPSKAFALPGVYNVKMVANFGACTDSMTRPVTVIAKPVAGFTADDTSSCGAPFPVQFTATGAPATSYHWNFGDGSTSTVANPSHTYLQTGNYTVTLVKTNQMGCSDTLVKSNYILIQPPVAGIANMPQEGCAPLAVSFTPTFSSPEPAVSWQWNFGDGQTSALQNPTHVFAPGNYDIRLIITTASGCTDTVTMPNAVRAGIKAHPQFTANPRVACARIGIQFTDTTSGVHDHWLWDFGDGETSTQQNPEHLYSDTGLFTVRLIVSNNGCPDTLTMTDYIHIYPPIAAFNVSFLCVDPYLQTFVDKSIGADVYEWNFGDGNTSSVPSPVHRYAAPGVYTVSLRVINNITGCDYITTHQVTIVDEHAAISISALEACRNSPVNFAAIGSNPANVAAYQWSYGDGGTGIARNEQHTYLTAGTYTPRLIIQDISGCYDTAYATQSIRINGPKANFGSASPGSCLMSTMTFNDSSLTDGIHPITSWTWTYGDGITETLTAPPFTHHYTQAGMYTVKLVVSDGTGCSDSMTKVNLLYISKPEAVFTTADTATCPGKNVTFQNGSTGPSLQYQWDFGDGQTSTNINPVHVYAADGVYTVKLIVIDQYGCSDTLTRAGYVSVLTPLARFAVSDSVSSCPPMVVNFTNNSQGVVSATWDFGDGNTSVVLNPTHVYAVPGIYIAKLTVAGQGGCSSVAQKTITVRGPYGSFSYSPQTGCKPLQVTFTATTTSRSTFIWDFNDGTTISTPDSVISHTYTIAGNYLPKMILRDVNGCMVPVTGPDTIRVKGLTAAFDADRHTLCGNGNVQFTGNIITNDPVATYRWDFGDGSISTSANPSHLYTAVGNYTPRLIATTVSGCSDTVSISVPIRVVKVPDMSITRTPDGCVPLGVQFRSVINNPDTSALHWVWSFGNGKQSLLAQPESQLYEQDGSFSARAIVTNSSGCSDTATATIVVFPLPLVNAGADNIVCRGKGINLQANGAASYQWSPAAGLSCTTCPNPLADPDSARRYIVTGRSAQGCFAKDTIQLSVQYRQRIQATTGDTACLGSPVELTARGSDLYTWSPSAGLANAHAATIRPVPTASTVYQVIGEDKNHCFSDTAKVPVKVYPIPTVNAGEDRTINVGQSIDLVPTLSPDVTEVTWSPTGAIFRSTFPSVTVKPTETTTYIVRASNPGGCKATDALTVYVICNGANVFVPNTFSPNNDGANDVFYPRGTGLFTIKSLKVFSRWGEVVYQRNDFRANDAAKGWDGKYKGNTQNPDVFVYVMEVICDNNTVLTFKGNIALIR